MKQQFFRLAWVCAVVGGLCGASLALAQEKGDPLIVPGKSVGEIKLGMDDREIERRLGKPSTGDAAAGRSWSAWFGKKEGGGRGAELDIKSHRTERGTESLSEAIRVESSFFHTRKGVSTKSSLADIWKAFPHLRYGGNNNADKAVETYVDPVHGMAIEVRRTQTSADTMAPAGAWGVCQAIIIFPASNDPENRSPDIRSMRDMPDE